MRLELLQSLLRVVDQSKAGALATTVLCAETEDGDLVLVGLVQVGQLVTELILGDVGPVGVEDVPEQKQLSQSRDSGNAFSGILRRIVDGVCSTADVLMYFQLVRVVSTSKSSNFSSIGVKERESLHDHLLAGKQRVADELASPQSDGSVGHFGGEW